MDGVNIAFDNNDGRMEVKTELTYNAQHQNIADTLKIANDPAQTIHKSYDNVGRLMALRYPSGGEVRTTFTELGQKIIRHYYHSCAAAKSVRIQIIPYTTPELIAN